MTPSPPALVDTHCHLAFRAFDEDRDEVIQRARAAGVVACVVVAVDGPTAREASELARSQAGWAFPTAGVHPTEPVLGDPRAFDEVAEVVSGGGYVAIGETGLDAFHDCAPLEAQVASLERHLELALRADLPVVLHCRDAYEAMTRALEPWKGTGLRGVLHCFCGGEGDLPGLLEVGLHVGVGGIATFKQRADLRAAVRTVPDDRLLIETDAPWLAPTPRRGRRNEPAYVAHVAECLAADRGMALDAFAALTTANAARLFGLPIPVTR